MEPGTKVDLGISEEPAAFMKMIKDANNNTYALFDKMTTGYYKFSHIIVPEKAFNEYFLTNTQQKIRSHCDLALLNIPELETKISVDNSTAVIFGMCGGNYTTVWLWKFDY